MWGGIRGILSEAEHIATALEGGLSTLRTEQIGRKKEKGRKPKPRFGVDG